MYEYAAGRPARRLAGDFALLLGTFFNKDDNGMDRTRTHAQAELGHLVIHPY
jgi:hypothetical protein